MEKKLKCCICKSQIEGYGHNAEPVMAGKCCNNCNTRVVVPARIFEMVVEKRNETKN